MRELVVDLFAGGGGASTGIEAALGVPIDIAINHDPEAIRMYWLNHPRTKPLPLDVWRAKPSDVVKGRPVGLLWASPDCTHHSRAKGKQPRENKRRCLADVITDHWGPEARPRVIIVENVPEFVEWGPVDKKGQPIKSKKGVFFREWVGKLRALGYVVEWRNLTASDYGVPTSRTRFFLIARCDGEQIVWPEPTHGPGLLPVRTAAECIDFSLPCPSIFLTKEEGRKLGYKIQRPLRENTLRRIARGIQKFIIEAADPFIVDETAMFLTKYHGDRGERSDGRGQSLNEPIRVIDTQNRFGLVAAFLSRYHGQSVGSTPAEPVPTVMGKNHDALVAAYLTKYYNTNIGSDLREPLPVVTGQGQHLGLVYNFLLKYYGTAVGQDLREPLHTVTSKDRMGLVQVRGQMYQIADIGLRMLTPAELLKAHSFPEDYVLVGTRGNMVAKIGNSVPPEMARVLTAANVTLRTLEEKAVG
jgi:DNA (cytosine-5)-methyltransferase 1